MHLHLTPSLLLSMSGGKGSVPSLDTGTHTQTGVAYPMQVDGLVSFMVGKMCSLVLVHLSTLLTG